MGYNFAWSPQLVYTAVEHLKYFYSTRGLPTLAHSLTLFHLGGCISYPIKLLFNPDPDPFAATLFLGASAQFNVLNESHNVFVVFLDICVTHRVMRHANFIAS